VSQVGQLGGQVCPAPLSCLSSLARVLLGCVCVCVCGDLAGGQQEESSRVLHALKHLKSGTSSQGTSGGLAP
jgi:hypothetical protein